MNKKTKIVTTIGPSSESEEILTKLLRSGANILRLNLKHNTHEWHKDLIQKIRRISKETGINCAIMADLQGPELRISTFNNLLEKVLLAEEQNVLIVQSLSKFHEEVGNKSNLLVIEFPKLDKVKGLDKDHKILIDDGKVVLRIKSIEDGVIKAEVEDGGELGIKKSVSIPDSKIDVPTLMEKDLRDLEFALQNDVDFIALSFVRNKGDITTLKEELSKHKGNQQIVAKIENVEGVDNIKEILELVDVIMVARGDLGVEIPLEKVPSIQENLIHLCRVSSKPVIVATQMLLSMIDNPIPTRAEVSDIAHAVFEGTDALMLSEETTAGRFPVKTVQTMAKVAAYNEKHALEKKHVVAINLDDYKPGSFEEMLIASSVRFSQAHPHDEDGKIKGYIVFTESGKSARILSRYRTDLPIYTFTSHEHVYRQLCISFGAVSFHMNLTDNPVDNIRNALKMLQEQNYVESGDKLIVIFGSNVGQPGANNTLSIITV